MQLSDVEKLAELSRIQIADSEKESILKDLQAILGYVDQIKEIEPREFREVQSLELYNVMREDVDAHQSGIYMEKILAEAPETKGGFIKVQAIL